MKNPIDTGETELTLKIVFMGFQARFVTPRPGREILLADFPSASTGSFRKSKDWMKRNFSVRPDIAVSCGSYVKNAVAPPIKLSILRQMGFFPEFLRLRQASEFDVVYAGTLRRPGVLRAIWKLSQLGMRVVVASPDSLPSIPGVTFVGLLGADDLYELFSRCVLGLNVVPNSAPFAYQASTKVIEYSAAGLGIVTSFNHWVREFECKRGGRFLDLDNAKSKRDLLTFPYIPADVSGLEWDTILRVSGLSQTIEQRIEGKKLV